MKKSTINVLLLLIILESPVLGFAIGLVFGSTADQRRMDAQYNEPWKQADGTHVFVEIVEASSVKVWARTADDRLYLYTWSYPCYDGDACLNWVEAEEVPDDIHAQGHGEMPIVKAETCPAFGQFTKEPPKNVAECVLAPYRSVVAWGTYYVLLNDGTIWFWQTPIPNDSPALTAMYYSFVGVVLGAIVSLMIVTTLVVKFISKLIQKRLGVISDT